MATRAFLWTTVATVDRAKLRVSFTPSRWFGLVFAPAFAATPVSLFWIETRGHYQLTGGGWIIGLGYAVIALVSAIMFLTPSNRSVVLDLAQRRLVIGGPWGFGAPLDVPLAEVETSYSESVRQHQGNTIYTGKLFASVGGRRHLVAHLANKAIGIVRQLAHLVPIATAGEPVDLSSLDQEVASNGRGAVLRALGLALLVTLPGLIYAASYGQR